MNNKCSNCRLVNFPDAVICSRCDATLCIEVNVASERNKLRPRILVRAAICLFVCLAVLSGFYLSLIGSAKSLTLNEKNVVNAAIALLREKGFVTEVMLLNNFTVYRSSDNWLNASVAKENAYAATNFPFEIMTLYSDFFTYPIDDTERAAILLHEARHLMGENEKDAYEFVWKHRKQLGWIIDKYADSVVWRNIRQQTKEHVPILFICDLNEYGDCTL